MFGREGWREEFLPKATSQLSLRTLQNRTRGLGAKLESRYVPAATWRLPAVSACVRALGRHPALSLQDPDKVIVEGKVCVPSCAQSERTMP